MNPRGQLAAACAISLLVGCGSGDAQLPIDAGDDGDSNVTLDSTGSDVAADADASVAPDVASASDVRDAPPTVLFGGTIFRKNSDVPILGAEVCLVNQPQIGCELTDTVGRFRFSVPADASLAITISGAGYAGIVAAFRTARVDLTSFTITLPTEHEEHAYFDAAGVEWPSTSRGFLFVFARDLASQYLAGLTMALSPSSGSGALYDDEKGAADKSLQATSASGTGHFGGIGPGEAEVVFGPPNLMCSPTFGAWPSNNPGKVRIPIVAGFETLLGVRCF